MFKSYQQYKQSGVEWLGEVPSHWGVTRLQNVLSERNEKNTKLKVIQILSLTMYQGIIPISEKLGSGGNKPKENLEDYKISYPNDIVLNSMNVVVGSVGLNKYTGLISPAYYALFNRDRRNNINYWYSIFQSGVFQKSLFALGKGILFKESSTGKLNTIRIKISMDSLNRVYIPYPPIEEQTQIATYLDQETQKIDNLILKQEKLIELLEEQRKSIISYAVTKGIDPNAKMKDSGVEWLGEVPEHWEIGKIKNFATVNPKITKQCISDNEDIEFIPMANIDEVKGIVSSINYRKFKEVSSGYTAFNSNDVVFAKITPCMENGNCAVIPDLKFGFGFGTTEFIVFRADNRLYNKFLYFILRNTFLRNICKKFMTGTAGQQRISSSFLASYPIAIPTISEQQQIVNFIETENKKIDQLIQKQTALIEKLKEYRSSIISHAVTGKIDVRHLIS